MKTMLLSLLVLLALTTTAFGIVCPANYCDTVRCEAITSCGGKIVQNGSFCGCCDLCVTLLQPGESCFALLLMGGTPPTVDCPDGYYCNPETVTCDALPTGPASTSE